MPAKMSADHAPSCREAFEGALADAITQADGGTGSATMAVVDVDLLGQVNAAHGIAAGDTVVLLLGRALKEALGANCRVERVGGDAYGVLWPGVEKERAFLAAEDFRASFTGPHVVQPDGERLELALNVSVGLAAYPDDGAKAINIMNKAFEALYRAKVSGRNRVCLAREEKMITKTSHYLQGQLMGLRRLAEREGIRDAVLLREALNDLLRKYNA